MTAQGVATPPSNASHSNIYPLPTSPPSPSPLSTMALHDRVRPRTMSLLSVKSGTSERLTFESSKAEPTVLTSNSFKKHVACGSFVPNTPATAVLRTFLPTMLSHVRGRPRCVSTHLEKEPGSPLSPSSPIPFITRTLPLSSGSRSPSPMRAHLTLPKARRRSRTRTRSEVQPHDLHPILASLEQRSKFCEKKSVCSTCNRRGSCFPQCGKCGDGWCSRECRLKGGKKHACRATPT